MKYIYFSCIVAVSLIGGRNQFGGPAKTTDLSQVTDKRYWGHRGRDHIVEGFTTTCAISAYHH
jgi:hypothetical protein